MRVAERGLTLLLVAVGVAVAPSAFAGEPHELPPGCRRLDTGAVVCDGEVPGGTTPTSSGPTAPTTSYPFLELWRPILSTGPDGTCVDSETVRLGRHPNPNEQLTSELQFMRWIRIYPLCPDITPPPVTTPNIEAASFVRRISYPTPEPYIEPGRLPVGFEAFLEIGTPTDQQNGPHNTPFGPLEVTSSAEIFVDWDDPYDDVDGEEGPYRVVIDAETGETRPARPGPHPNGEIKHLYQHDGHYEIRVRMVWTADWRIGTDHSGTITGLETSGTYPAPGFEVFSRQAVG